MKDMAFDGAVDHGKQAVEPDRGTIGGGKHTYLSTPYCFCLLFCVIEASASVLPDL